jgi:hypothetical protein
MDELEESYASADEIPAGYAKLYKEVAGADGAKSWQFAGVKGVALSGDQKKLRDEAGRHRIEATKHQRNLASWTALGESPDKVRETLDRIVELEATVAAGGGKSKEAVDKLVEARMATEGTKTQRLLGEKDKTITGLTARVERFENAARTGYVLDQVRSAMAGFKGGKFAPSAMEDVLLYAERHFETEADHDSETGELVISGSRTRDKVGVTPGVDVNAWLLEMVGRKPHWLEPSEGVGGGPEGRRGNGGLGNNPWGEATFNLTEQAKYIQQHGEQKARNACKVAGAEWGATRHPKSSATREQQRR